MADTYNRPLPKSKPLYQDRLRRTERAITKAKGTDKLWGPEVREYVEGIRKGDIDDPDFLRAYEATQKGLGHYKEQEVSDMGMEDPFLPAAIKRTTPASRRARELLSKGDDVPLVALGLDPTRTTTDPVTTNMLGFYSRKGTDEAPFTRSLMKKKEGAADRPYLYKEGDFIRTERLGPRKSYAGDPVPQSVDTDTVLFHEAAHRGLEILKESTDFKLPRLTKNLTIATDNTSKEDIIDKDYNEEIWVRLLQQKHYPSSTKEQQKINTEKNREYFKELRLNNIINLGDYKIRGLLKADGMEATKEGLDYIRDSAAREREARGFPKPPESEKPTSLLSRFFKFQKGGTNIDNNDSMDAITRHHYKNLAEGKAKKLPDGRTATVATMQVQIDGVPTLVPSVWDGEIIEDEKDVIKKAKEAMRAGTKWPQIIPNHGGEAAYAEAHAKLREFDKDIHKNMKDISAKEAQNILDTNTKFQKGGANMADVDMAEDNMQDQMLRSGLVADPDEVDPISGNEIPLGATAEGVRDDETAAISPGEFVIPDYAVRYHGIDFYVESLQTAQQGLQQMEGMGLVGNPDDQTIPDEAPLPVMSDATGNEEMLDTGEPAEQEFQTGGLTTTTLPQAPQQGGLTTTALPQVPQQQVISQPPPLTQPLRPTTTQPVPVSPTFGQLQPQALTYRASQGPTAGLPGGYSVEEFIDDAGNKIFLTEIGGKVTEGVPSGFRRAKGRDGSIGLPGTITPIQPKSSFELPEIGSAASAAGTALGALSTFNALNKLTGGKLQEGAIELIKGLKGGPELLEKAFGLGGEEAVTELTAAVTNGGPEVAENLITLTQDPQGAGAILEGFNAHPIPAQAADTIAGGVSGGVAPAAVTNVPLIPSGVPGLSPGALGGLSSAAGAKALATIGTGGGIAGGTGLTGQALNVGLAKLAGAKALGAIGTGGGIAGGTGLTGAALNTGLAKLAGAKAGVAGGLGATMSAMAPMLIPAAILALPTIAGMISGSSNRLEAAKQAGSKVEELLLNPDFNETNAARIRALTGLKGDKGKYGDVPNEGRVSSIGGALNRLEQAGGIDAIPSAAGKEMYKLLKAEIRIRDIAMKRASLGVSADEQEQYARLSPKEVEEMYQARHTGP